MRTIDHVLGKDGRGSARAGPGQLYFSIQVEKMAENCQKTTNFKKFPTAVPMHRGNFLFIGYNLAAIFNL